MNLESEMYMHEMKKARAQRNTWKAAFIGMSIAWVLSILEKLL